jgi:hypothetical protein
MIRGWADALSSRECGSGTGELARRQTTPAPSVGGRGVMAALTALLLSVTRSRRFTRRPTRPSLQSPTVINHFTSHDTQVHASLQEGTLGQRQKQEPLSRSAAQGSCPGTRSMAGAAGASASGRRGVAGAPGAPPARCEARLSSSWHDPRMASAIDQIRVAGRPDIGPDAAR